MGKLVELLFPVFSLVKSYGEMLYKLAYFAFLEVYLVTFVLRTIPAIDNACQIIENIPGLATVEKSLPIPNVAGAAVALLFAGFASFTWRLHDRISDLLSIRKRFEVCHILLPLAARVGVGLSRDKLMSLPKSERKNLMNAVFWRYASSTDDQPLVSKHDIYQALTVWSWYWVAIEGACIFGLASVAAFAFGPPHMGGWFAGVAGAFVIFSLLWQLQLWRRTAPEVDTITSDHNASIEVRNRLNAL